MNKETLLGSALEAIAQAPSFSIAALDRQGRVILWSPSATRMFGWTEADTLGRPLCDLPFIPEEERPEIPARIQRSLEGDPVVAFDVRRFRKDGSLIDVSLWTAPLRDDSAQIIGTVVVLADVTARKKAEEALHQTEAELHRVLSAASDYFWSGEIDPEGRFRYRYYSPAVERITGRPAEFYMAGSERWMSTIHPEDRPRLAEISARLLSGQAVSSDDEHRIVLPDGTIRWVHARVTVSPAAGGYRRLDGAVSDITVRKQAEEMLRDSEERFRGIFAAAATGIVLVSEDGRFLHANPAFCEFVGYSEQELLNKTILDVTHPDDRKASWEFRRQVWEGKEPLVQRYEKRYLRKDGRIMWGEVNLSLIRDAMGRAGYSIAHVLDVTKRKRAEAAARESEERLRALIEHGFDVVAVVQADGTTQFTGASTARVLGYQPHEWVGRNALELVHPKDLPRVTEVLNQLLQIPGGTMVEQFRCRHKDGSWRWVEASGTNCLAQPAVGGIILNYRDITGRKQTEEVLRESEERYRTLAESAADAIYIVDRDDCVQYLNARAASMLGSTPEELTGKRRMELFPPDISKQRGLEFQTVFQSGDPRHFQNKTPFPHGESWVDTWLVPLRGKSGEISGVMGITRDITEQKRTEEALRESEERYRLMADAIPHPAWSTNALGETTECNRRWYEYTGQTPEEARGNGRMNALHPDDRGRVMQKLKDDVAGGELHETEYRLRRATDGSYRWHLARALPIKDENGRIACWIGSAADIDDQKKAEEMLRRAHDQLQKLVGERTQELLAANAALVKGVAERKHAEEAMRQSEVKYRSLVEEIPAITYIAALDEASTTLYVSPQAESLLGFALADYKANPHSIWLDHLHPADRERVIAQLQRTHTEHEPFDCEYRMLKHDGGIIWFRDRAVLVRDAAGRPLFLQGVMLDITEQKRLEGEIIEVSEREQERIGQDLHDSLCQRLTGISLLCQTLSATLAAKAVPVAADARKIGQLVKTTIREARDLARGLCPVELGSNDLGLALKGLGLLVERLFDVSVTLRYQRRVKLKDRAAAIHMYRIAQEAISNAVRHGKASRIQVDLVRRKNELTMRVRDNGSGFVRRRSFGRGMGMHIMKHRAEMIGAVFAVESKRGTGTTVTCVYAEPIGHRGK